MEPVMYSKDLLKAKIMVNLDYKDWVIFLFLFLFLFSSNFFGTIDTIKT